MIALTVSYAAIHVCLSVCDESFCDRSATVNSIVILWTEIVLYELHLFKSRHSFSFFSTN